MKTCYTSFPIALSASLLISTLTSFYGCWGSAAAVAWDSVCAEADGKCRYPLWNFITYHLINIVFRREINKPWYTIGSWTCEFKCVFFNNKNSSSDFSFLQWLYYLTQTYCWNMWIYFTIGAWTNIMPKGSLNNSKSLATL